MGRSKAQLPDCARFLLPSVILLFFKPSPAWILCWTSSLTYWVSPCLSALTGKQGQMMHWDHHSFLLCQRDFSEPSGEDEL